MENSALDEKIRYLARLLAANCVSKPLMEYGKLTNDALDDFGAEVADKLYTYLHFFYAASPEDKEAFFSQATISLPDLAGEQPQLDEELMEGFQARKAAG